MGGGRRAFERRQGLRPGAVGLAAGGDVAGNRRNGELCRACRRSGVRGRGGGQGRGHRSGRILLPVSVPGYRDGFDGSKQPWVPFRRGTKRRGRCRRRQGQGRRRTAGAGPGLNGRGRGRGFGHGQLGVGRLHRQDGCLAQGGLNFRPGGFGGGRLVGGQGRRGLLAGLNLGAGCLSGQRLFDRKRRCGLRARRIAGRHVAGPLPQSVRHDLNLGRPVRRGFGRSVLCGWKNQRHRRCHGCLKEACHNGSIEPGIDLHVGRLPRFG